MTSMQVLTHALKQYQGSRLDTDNGYFRITLKLASRDFVYAGYRTDETIESFADGFAGYLITYGLDHLEEKMWVDSQKFGKELNKELDK